MIQAFNHFITNFSCSLLEQLEFVIFADAITSTNFICHSLFANINLMETGYMVKIFLTIKL